MQEIIMDFRKIFDTIPDEFDKWRPRYCDELFNDVIDHSKLNSNKTALEIGPGTGQATEPVLKTGCSYLAIELGENLAAFIKNKFKSYDNLQIINADFELYDFGRDRFDLVYSAAAFQWIKEDIGYPKVFDILKSGGTFATFGTGETPENRKQPVYAKIQEVYTQYFKPEIEYTCDLKTRNKTPEESQQIHFDILNKYGFVNIEYRYYDKTRELTADEFVSYTKTNATSITLKEPYKSKFYSGIREVVLSFDNKIKIYDRIILYLARKP